MFGHEKFKAYQFAIQFVALASHIIEKLPDGHGKLIDQLRRASFAIVLNIAEGSGKSSLAQRANSYSVARGEAMECAAIMDVLESSRLIHSETREQGKELLKNVVAILSAVIRKKAAGSKTRVGRP